VSLFNIFKSKAKNQLDILESLLQAAEEQNSKKLASLCGEHQEEIRKSFVVWSKVPDSVRKNPAAMKRYAEGLIAVARTFEHAGDTSLLSHLIRTPSESPLVQWQTDLAEAQSRIDRGMLSEAITLLQAVLSRNAPLLGGTGVDFYLPRTYGMLGAAYFKAGDKNKAIDCMSKAKSLCEQSGDTEGAAIYEGNLCHLEEHT